MKKINLLPAISITYILALTALSSYAQVPNWQWAKGAGGSSSDIARSVAADASGNSYVVGTFESPSITFGATTLTNAGTFSVDMFLVKYDAGGNVLWAKGEGGSESDDASSVVVDASGNIYVGGYFESPSITFGATTLTNAGIVNMFLVKYDEDGNVLWAKSAGGTVYDYANSVAVDTVGNSYVAGEFYSPSITFDATTLTNASAGGTDDMFLVKYDAGGNVLWAKSAGEIDNDDGSSVAADAAGNSYAAGYFRSATITFDATTLTNANAGEPDMFIAKYDAVGNVLWAKSAGGSDHDRATSIDVDASGNSYVAGYFFSPTINFGAGDLTNANPGKTDDMFLVKYDGNGNVVWSKSAEGSDYDEAHSVAADASGNSYLGGWFDSPTLTFDTNSLTNAGNEDVFFVKYDASGNVLWAKSAGGFDTDEANSVATDASGNSYVAGLFSSLTIAFDSTTLTKAGGDDMFIAKVGGVTGINDIFNSLHTASASPNPFTNELNLRETKENETAIIFDVAGKEILRQKTNATETKINTVKLLPGFYILNYTEENKTANIKVVKF